MPKVEWELPNSGRLKRLPNQNFVLELHAFNITPSNGSLHILFKCMWNKHQRNHGPGYKTYTLVHLKEWKECGVFSVITTELEINGNNASGNLTHIWKLNNMCLDNVWINEGLTRETENVGYWIIINFNISETVWDVTRRNLTVYYRG